MSIKPRKRTQEEFREQLHQVAESLEINISAFNEGKSGGWLAVAAQLNVLLCDEIPIPLVERVIPGFSLHPLLKDLSDRRQGYLLYLPRVQFAPLGLTPQLFDFEQPKIPLAEWLEQTVAILNVSDSGVPITLRNLITELRDQSGPGHFTPSARETAQATTGFKFLEGGKDTPFHEKYLVAIAGYVLSETREQYEQMYKGQVRVQDKMCIIEGDAYLTSTPSQAVDFSQGAFVHAVVLCENPRLLGSKTLFEIAATDSPLKLRVWIDEQNSLNASLNDVSNRHYSLDPIAAEHFVDKLVFVACSIRPLSAQRQMKLLLNLSDQHLSERTIEPSLGEATGVRISIGTTVDGSESADLRLADLGIGTGVLAGTQYNQLRKQVAVKWGM